MDKNKKVQKIKYLSFKNHNLRIEQDGISFLWNDQI
jgi:hypothetical protein